MKNAPRELCYLVNYVKLWLTDDEGEWKLKNLRKTKLPHDGLVLYFGHANKQCNRKAIVSGHLGPSTDACFRIKIEDSCRCKDVKNKVKDLEEFIRLLEIDGDLKKIVLKVLKKEKLTELECKEIQQAGAMRFKAKIMSSEPSSGSSSKPSSFGTPSTSGDPISCSEEIKVVAINQTAGQIGKLENNDEILQLPYYQDLGEKIRLKQGYDLDGDNQGLIEEEISAQVKKRDRKIDIKSGVEEIGFGERLIKGFCLNFLYESIGGTTTTTTKRKFH